MTATIPEFNLIVWQDKLVSRFKRSHHRAGRLIWAQAQKQLMARGFPEREAYSIVGDASEVAWNERSIEDMGK